MIVDFVGSGLRVNPNLWLYWSKQIMPILVLFLIQSFLLCYVFLKSKIIHLKSVFLFCGFWFIVSLLPVVFLPIHKFTFYLTLPLVGIVFFLSHLFVNLKSKIVILFGVIWTILSMLTLNLAIETNWITQGELVSKRVFNYFYENRNTFGGRKIVFVDKEGDKVLPWSPTLVIGQSLSEKSFFHVFYPELTSNVSYSGKGDVEIESRQFLGY
jgi:hypothetical protein